MVGISLMLVAEFGEYDEADIIGLSEFDMDLAVL